MVDVLVAMGSVLLYLVFGAAYYIRVVPGRYRKQMAVHQTHQHYLNHCPCGKWFYNAKQLDRYSNDLPEEIGSPFNSSEERNAADAWVKKEKERRFTNIEAWRDKRSQREASFQAIGLGLIWFPIFLLFLGKIIISPATRVGKKINDRAFKPIENEKTLRRLEEDMKKENN